LRPPKSKTTSRSATGGFTTGGAKKGIPGRTLTLDDIAHYQRVVVALKDTVRLMKEIDQAIESHGGWPID